MVQCTLQTATIKAHLQKNTEHHSEGGKLTRNLALLVILSSIKFRHAFANENMDAMVYLDRMFVMTALERVASDHEGRGRHLTVTETDRTTGPALDSYLARVYLLLQQRSCLLTQCCCACVRAGVWRARQRRDWRAEEDTHTNRRAYPGSGHRDARPSSIGDGFCSAAFVKFTNNLPLLAMYRPLSDRLLAITGRPRIGWRARFSARQKYGQRRSVHMQSSSCL